MRSFAARRVMSDSSECRSSLFVAPLRHMDFFVNQRLFVHDRSLTEALELPSRDVREIFVVALRFAVFGLILFAEMAAARFFARQGIEHEQFGELHKIGYAARAFK